MYPQSVSLNIVFNFLLHGLEQGSQVKGTIFLSLFNILMFIHKHVCVRERVYVFMCVCTHTFSCATEYVRSENNLLKLVISFYCVVLGWMSGPWTWQHHRSESPPPFLWYLDTLLNAQYPDSFPALVWPDPSLWNPHTPDVFLSYPHLHGFPHHPWTRVLSPHSGLSSLRSHRLWNNPQFSCLLFSLKPN